MEIDKISGTGNVRIFADEDNGRCAPICYACIFSDLTQCCNAKYIIFVLLLIELNPVVHQITKTECQIKYHE